MEEVGRGRVKIPYAKFSIDKLVDLDQLVCASYAKSGVNYYCPDCNAVLRKRISHKGVHHFFHLGADDGCGGVETTLHLLAKKVLEIEKAIWLPNPSLYYHFINPVETEEGFESLESGNPLVTELNKVLSASNQSPAYTPAPQSEIKDTLELKAFLDGKGLSLGRVSARIPYEKCEIANVRVEKGLGDIRPDIIATIAGRDHLIEVANTHFVDDKKAEKIKSLNLPCVEVDLSGVSDVTYEGVRRLITQPNHATKWIHFPPVDSVLSELKESKREADDQFIRVAIKEKRREQVRKRQLEKQEKEKEKAVKQAQENQWVIDTQTRVLKKAIERRNQESEAKGLPRMRSKYGLEQLSGLEGLLKAIKVRDTRIAALGVDDLLVKRMVYSEDWNRLEDCGELLMPSPPSLKHLFESWRLAEEYSQRKEVFIQRMEEEKNKGSGGCMNCPRCRRPSFQFFTVRPGELYVRRCAVKACGHQEWYSLN